VPEYAFSLQGEVLAFEAYANLETSLDVKDLSKAMPKFDEVLVYQIDPNGKVELLEHQYESGFVQASFLGGHRYLVYAIPLDARLRDTYHALCRFHTIGINQAFARGVLDQLCLVILCANDQLQAEDVFAAIPAFSPFKAEIGLLPDLRFGGFNSKPQDMVENISTYTTNICDRCTGFGRNLIIPDPRCGPPPGRVLPPPAPSFVELVNMVPEAWSDERGKDSNPSFSVDVENPSLLAGSSHTTNPNGDANNTMPAPIYVSEDSGRTWRYEYIIPEYYPLSIRIANGHHGKELFAAYNILFGLPTFGEFRNAVVRTDDLTSGEVMERIDTLRGIFPDIQTVQTPAERIYLSFTRRDWEGNFVAPRQPVSCIEISENGGQSFTQTVLNVRNTPSPGETTFSTLVRAAIAPDGTVYVAYFENSHSQILLPRTVAAANIRIVRDDAGGIGPDPFQELVDPADGLKGKMVRLDIRSHDENERVLGTWENSSFHLELAVDPNDSRTVYLVWEDLDPNNWLSRLGIAKSTDGGESWSEDIRRIPRAINPKLAFSKNGTLGFLYQAIIAGEWVTILEQTKDDFASYSSTSLAKFP
ncbi:MAG: hypothetical protein AAFQ68_28565, partial [Bacteroidota bacterium]